MRGFSWRLLRDYRSGNFTRRQHHAWSVSSQAGGAPFQVFNTVQANLNTGAVWNNVTAALGFDATHTQATGIGVSAHDPNVACLSLSGFTAVTGIHHIYRTRTFGGMTGNPAWVIADNGLPDIPVLRVMVDNTDDT